MEILKARPHNAHHVLMVDALRIAEEGANHLFAMRQTLDERRRIEKRIAFAHPAAE